MLAITPTINNGQLTVVENKQASQQELTIARHRIHEMIAQEQAEISQAVGFAVDAIRLRKLNTKGLLAPQVYAGLCQTVSPALRSKLNLYLATYPQVGEAAEPKRAQFAATKIHQIRTALQNYGM